MLNDAFLIARKCLKISSSSLDKQKNGLDMRCIQLSNPRFPDAAHFKLKIMCLDIPHILKKSLCTKMTGTSGGKPIRILLTCYFSRGNVFDMQS